MQQLWPWLAIAGMGAGHGLNPAMGWPFVAALGVGGRKGFGLLRSLLSIAAGHAASVGVVAAAIAAGGVEIESRPLRFAAGGVLLGWGLFRLARRQGHPMPLGEATGVVGLAAWSFVMATADGAGLMLVPALVPICASSGAGHGLQASASVAVAAAVVSVHMAAMLAATGGAALVIRDSTRAALRRWRWLDHDRLWVAALLVTGTLLVGGAWG